jgi:hypothetical protein
MSEFRVHCPRCDIPLSKVGRRDFHFGPVLRHDSRINKMVVELFVCVQCGHLEQFHPKIGATARCENPPYELGQGFDGADDGDPGN